MTTYRPPHANRNVIEKITSSAEGVFAALSSNGELFTFVLPPPTDALVPPGWGKAREVVRPQRVWALRKKFSSVKVRSTFFIPRRKRRLMKTKTQRT